MLETQDDLLSFGDRNSAGNLETMRTVVGYSIPVFQIRSPDLLVKFIVYINGGTKMTSSTIIHYELFPMLLNGKTEMSSSNTVHHEPFSMLLYINGGTITLKMELTTPTIVFHESFPT